VAIRKGYEGSVVLYVTVDANGGIKDISVGTGSGYRSLDKAALNAVKRWRFEPALQNGQAVESVAEVPVIFRLVDAKS
jgi:protein TonB